MTENRQEPQIKQTCFIFKCILYTTLFYYTLHYVLLYCCSKVAISFLLSCRRISGLAEAGNDGNGTLRLAGNQLCPRPEATEIELLLDDTSTFSWGIHVNFARQKKGKEKISRILLFYPCTMGWNSYWGIRHTHIHGRLWFLIFLPFGYWEKINSVSDWKLRKLNFCSTT